MDEREGMSPGFKFNDWEMRGVPLRLELGPKDVAKGSVVLARRDRPGKEGKSFVPQEGHCQRPSRKMLEEIQQALFDKRARFPQSQHRRARRLRAFKPAVEKGFALLMVVRRRDCEEKIKEETKATMRCIPLEQLSRGGPADVHLLRQAGARQRLSSPAHTRPSELSAPYRGPPVTLANT